MTNEGGSLQIVFNGELYNYVELRRKLEAHGHQFRTKSDTEVIVHSYEQWGTECVTRFNGMFAFALWDSVHRTVFIARDHLGIKPLYFFESGTTMRFASEIKALLQHPSCPREVDLDSLLELFTFRYVPAPKTLFRHIYKLSPGHYMLCTREGVRVTRFGSGFRMRTARREKLCWSRNTGLCSRTRFVCSFEATFRSVCF